jgi:hypothetical protein
MLRNLHENVNAVLIGGLIISHPIISLLAQWLTQTKEFGPRRELPAGSALSRAAQLHHCRETGRIARRLISARHAFGND